MSLQLVPAGVAFLTRRTLCRYAAFPYNEKFLQSIATISESGASIDQTGLKWMSFLIGQIRQVVKQFVTFFRIAA